MFSQRRISQLLSQNGHLEQASTDIDLLRVSTEPVKNQDLVYWKEGLDDSSIRAHLTTTAEKAFLSNPSFIPRAALKSYID
ncbi:MAG: hypothetical protein Q9185_007035 [Variospora sp. 1 TL-2023]